MRLLRDSFRCRSGNRVTGCLFHENALLNGVPCSARHRPPDGFETNRVGALLAGEENSNRDMAVLCTMAFRDVIGWWPEIKAVKS